jgi:hypothetical protein
VHALAVLAIVIVAFPGYAQEGAERSCSFWLSAPQVTDVARRLAVDIFLAETAQVPLHGVGWSVLPAEVADNAIANCAAHPDWTLKQAVELYMFEAASYGR